MVDGDVRCVMSEGDSPPVKKVLESYTQIHV
jgi:hypothetical protein